jgi:hypothetical protein
MPISPEDRARENIDRLLTEAGWIVQPRPHSQLPFASVQYLSVPASCSQHLPRSARHSSTCDLASILPPVTSHASPITNSFRIRRVPPPPFQNFSCSHTTSTTKSHGITSFAHHPPTNSNRITSLQKEAGGDAPRCAARHLLVTHGHTGTAATPFPSCDCAHFPSHRGVYAPCRIHPLRTYRATVLRKG